ncbi:MAG: tetratricopeptide repeat protein [Betaproteobacteria bacterium]|nr:tetratricopeptide repeat protein [Betaproteobacteria bacterium]
MMIFKRSAIIFSLLLAACAHAPRPAVEQVATPEPQAEKPEKSLDLPQVELTRQMLYEFMLGDVASQRGAPEMAAQIYMKLAASTRDPRVARRAAHLAYNAHEMDKAVEAFKLWLELEPASLEAKQMLSLMLIGGGRLDEARPYLADMLAAYPGRVGHALMQIYPFFVQQPDKIAVFDLLRELTRPYPRVAEGHMVLAEAAEAAGKREVALDEVRKARALQAEWEMAVLFEAQLLQRESPQEALALLKKHLVAYPEAADVRLFYARMLLEQKQYAESRTEFQRLLNAHPENAELAFAVAMLSLQMGELEQAESRLRQALAKGKKDEDTVYYYLGQLGEAKKNSEEALQNYRKVQDGEYVYAARLRAAYLLYKTGKLNEARDYLHQTVVQNNQQRVQLMSIEAQILREAKQPEAAYQVLTQGLEKLPNHPDLLYEAAMLADQIGKHEVFEQMMRKVIQFRPDNAQAYNALGYSLLERNERVQEGMQLVEKANQLAPNDFAIIDSVGWGYYRLGNIPKSLEFLRRAYNANPDPEIAAHLGEVLWVQGEKVEAKKVWDDALKSHPDNAVLQEAMKRFLP